MTSAPVLAATASEGSTVSYALLLLPLLALGWLWLLVRRRRSEVTQRTTSLEVGSRVVTTSGLMGTLVGRDGGEARIEAAPGVVLTFDERALMDEAPTTHPHQTGGAPADPAAPPKEAD